MQFLPLAMLCCLCGCSLSPDLPLQAPALADMEEPLDLRAEPDDEAERQRLPFGSFSGIYVDDARDTLADKLDQPGQLRIAQVIENSPAAAAGLQPDDLLLEVVVGDAAPRPLARPSEWRQLELETPPGTKIVLFVDRAGREARAELELVPRQRSAAREQAERFREEQRVGVVLRTATEVEARKANLGPGGGAVIVGLSRNSPWRSAGLRFGDLLTAVDGRSVAHPQDVLTTLRDPALETVRIDFLRNGAPRHADASLSQRNRDLTEVTVPLLLSYSSDRGASEFSLLLGIFNYRSTAAAWRFRLFWLFAIGAGDTDQLLEVGS
ncbi:MAG TPA: PDZ domain-containing protein [Planctomycetota bacterium]